MRRNQDSRKPKQDEITHHTWAAGADALGKREEYPPEEFAGFENFGEFPEWHPGEAGARINREALEGIVDSEIRK